MKRILNAKILFSLVLAFALFAGILAATVHAADPTFRSVGITTGESLKEYLELDGNFIINVSADIQPGSASRAMIPTGRRTCPTGARSVRASRSSTSTGTK